MPISYHDWELGFKKKDLDKINSLGMTRKEFKEYIQKWKEENLKKTIETDKKL